MSSTRKSLYELKVVELKHELEKRHLDKQGVKSQLLSRLEEAIRKEGADPASFVFNIDPSAAFADSTSDAGDAASQKVENDTTALEPATTTTDEGADIPDEQPEEDVTTGLMLDNDPELEPISEEELETEPEKVSSSPPTRENKIVASKVVEPPEEEDATKTESDAKKTSAEKGTKPGTEKDDDCSLWVSNIPNTTKASDLKTLFSNHGKVSTAKIFTTRSTSSPACFGSVTMCDTESALSAKANLHRSNWKGRIICVETIIERNASAAAVKEKKSSAAKDKASARKPIEPPRKSPEKNVAERRSDSTKDRNSEQPAGKKAASPKRGSSSGSQRREIKPPSKSPQPKSSSRSTAKPELKKSSSGASGTASKYHHSSTAGSDSTRPARFASTSVRRGGAHLTGPRSYSRADERDRYQHREAPNHHRVIKAPSRGGSSYSRPASSYDERRTYVRPTPKTSYYSSNAPRVFDEDEVRRLMAKTQEEHRRREEALEREREKTQIRLEREKLERERLEVEQMKLRLQMEAQQHKAAVIAPAFYGVNPIQQAAQAVAVKPKPSRGPEPTRHHDQRDSRARHHSRSRSPRNSRPGASGSRRSPAPRRHDDFHAKEKYASTTSSSSRSRPGGAPSNTAAGYSTSAYATSDRRGARSPIQQYGSNSYNSTAGASSKRGNDSTNALNERLAALSNVYGTAGGISNASAAQFLNSRMAAAGGSAAVPSSYNRLENYASTGASYASSQWPADDRSQAAAASSAAFDSAGMPGSWSRPSRDDWYGSGNAAQPTSYNKSSYSSSRRY